MLNLSYEEKIDLLRSLNWDSVEDCKTMLAVIEGQNGPSDASVRERLFVRSLERLPWHYLTALWGIDAIKELYTLKCANSIWPKERRRHFDFALAVLRGDPLPDTRWGTEYYKSKRYRFFSDRGNSS